MARFVTDLEVVIFLVLILDGIRYLMCPLYHIYWGRTLNKKNNALSSPANSNKNISAEQIGFLEISQPATAELR